MRTNENGYPIGLAKIDLCVRMSFLIV